MPIHDWTRIFAGAFHHFHQAWVVRLSDALNSGVLPDGFYAAAEQVTSGRSPDVVTLETFDEIEEAGTAQTSDQGGLLTVEAPPKVRYEFESELRQYANKADRIAIRHVSSNRIVSIIEVVSPGNKHSGRALKSLKDKVYSLIDNEIHILLIDLIPPGTFDPEGLPRALSLDADDVVPAVTNAEPLSLCSLQMKPAVHGYVELCAVGSALPQMPLFLSAERYVNLPLEETYTSSWHSVPDPWKKIVEAE